MKTFLRYQDEFYTQKDFKTALQNLGIKSGALLCVHTELFNFGTPLVSKDEFLGLLLNAFYELLGENGTLIMPTFTYSFCRYKDYDKLKTKSTMGILTEFFRKQSGVVRTNDPIFSFAIKGALKNEFLSDTKSCFAKDCVYDKLYKNGGKIVLLGTEKLGYTFTHFIEEQIGVSYRYFKEFSGILTDEKGQKTRKSIKLFVRDLELDPHLSLEKHISLLKKTNNFKSVKFGGAKIVLIDAKKYFKTFFEALKQDENALLE